MNNLITNYLLSDSELIDLRERGISDDINAWYFGDFCAILSDRLTKAKTSIIRGDTDYPQAYADEILALGTSTLHQFIAEIAGKAARTVERYARISAFFPPEMRERYTGLPHSHYEFAMRFSDYAEDILDIDLRLMDSNNCKPVSLGILQSMFQSVDQVPDALETYSEIASVDDILALSGWDDDARDPENKERIPTIVWHFLRNLDTIASYIRRAVDSWNIKDNSKAQIIATVEQLNELVKDALTDSQKVDIM